MKNNLIILLFILSFSLNTKAQNLILNGSFENNSCNVNSAGNAYESLTNNMYDTTILNSSGFGTDENIDILKLNSDFCGAAQDGIWYAALTSGGTDAFSFKLSAAAVQNNIYSLSFYSRAYSSTFPGCPVQIGLSNSDTLFGTLIYTNAVPPDTCQWVQSAFSFTAPITAQYLTVTCGGPNNSSSDWIHVDNFVLDTGGSAGIKLTANNNEIVNVYPNPANNKINVDANNINEIKLFDILGSQILSTKQKEIDVSNVSEGVYFVKVIANDGKPQIQKLIISK